MKMIIRTNARWNGWHWNCRSRHRSIYWSVTWNLYERGLVISHENDNEKNC